MPPSTRSRSKPSLPTTPLLRQQHLSPLTKSVGARPTPPFSRLQKQRQQTLTQIDFVPHVEHDDGELEYEVAGRKRGKRDGGKIGGGRRRKRRRTEEVPDSTLTQMKWVTREREGEDEEEGLEYDAVDGVEEGQEELGARRCAGPAATRGASTAARGTPTAARAASSARATPAARTSASTARTATPSARTATTWANPKKSTKKTFGKKTKPTKVFRSSSQNLMPPPQTPRKTFGSEIESSQSPEGSPISVRATSPVKERVPLGERSVNLGHTHSAPKRVQEKAILSSPPVLRRPSALEIPSVLRTPTLLVEDTFSASEKSQPILEDAVAKPAGRKIVKLEIEDSDEELDYSLEEFLPQLDRLPSETGPSAIEAEDPRVPSPAIEQEESIVPQRSDGSGESQPVSHDVQSFNSTAPVVEGTHNSPAVSCPQSVFHSNPESPPLRPPKNTVPALGRSDSAQASAQLMDDLTRVTQPQSGPVLDETETQDHASLGPLRSPDISFMPNSRSDERHLPKMPVSISQATTVDLTQASPTQATTTLQTTTSTEVNTIIPSSPPTRPTQASPARDGDADDLLIPSSPLVASKSPLKKMTWDRERLTDSQLLPDSIMNFELPPSSTAGSLARDTQ